MGTPEGKDACWQGEGPGRDQTGDMRLPQRAKIRYGNAETLAVLSPLSITRTPPQVSATHMVLLKYTRVTWLNRRRRVQGCRE